MDTAQAHKFSGKHRASLEASETCGCFHCIKRFNPTEIKHWTGDGQTAICPKCGIDAVLGSHDVPKLTDKFLKQMHSAWFGSASLLPIGTVVEILGWVGTIAIVSAYALLNFGQFETTDDSYQFLNIAGSFGLILSALHKKDYQPVVLNIVWIAVAIIALLGNMAFAITAS